MTDAYNLLEINGYCRHLKRLLVTYLHNLYFSCDSETWTSWWFMADWSGTTFLHEYGYRHSHLIMIYSGLLGKYNATISWFWTLNPIRLVLLSIDYIIKVTLKHYRFRLLIIGSICCVCCGDLYKSPLWRLQRSWSRVTLGCARATKGIGPLL